MKKIGKMWLFRRKVLIPSYLLLVTFLLIFVLSSAVSGQNRSSKTHTIENLQNEKEFKKLLKTKNNILVIFMNTSKENQNILKIFRESSDLIKGLGTMVAIDCSTGDLKKLCKKLKVAPSPFVMKHYKDGEFHKVYDRAMTVASITNFMKDPTGDIPWEEDPTGVDVVHIADPTVRVIHEICVKIVCLTSKCFVYFRPSQNCSKRSHDQF